MPVKQIPSSLTRVDADGKETHEPMAWNVLPPPKDCCQVCGVRHEPGNAHNADSLYYQMTFNGMIGRSPTWADAVAHCDPEIKDWWEYELRKLGKWTEPPKGEKPVIHHGGI